ncbi:hypothetical protein [Nocardioides bruguierae]|uniref:DNA-directed RNA polymerase specialized sigma24 family protein n=1 Tax=Nocardioides bruguierae TaxID=2945102 RepID=A0A9X2DAU7_9ACTN|nr:hypothetical protein [Nocardioides bruguierae]MCM0621239.1 hypothetical protein [Nocardioides bruguierae]
MTDQQDFDDFYAEARERLLLQAYALTGDLKASRSAVRDTTVQAWHHWRRITADGATPESWVRPRAWALAHRRQRTHVWHREKSLDEGVRTTLEALAGLSWTQRRVLVMSHLAGLSITDAAREVGVTTDQFTRDLQLGTAAVALAADQPSTQVPVMLRGLVAGLDDVRWTRPARLRRSGATRRRGHLVAGVALVVASVAVTGLVVHDPEGARPSLDRSLSGVSTAAPRSGDASAAAGSADASASGSASADPEPAELAEDAMLTAGQLQGTLTGRGWKVLETDHNVDGDGLVLSCQQVRYADTEVEDALVRTFRSAPARGTVRTTTQMTEQSADAAVAADSFETWSEWLSGCTDARTQLMAVREVSGVGNEALQVVLRDWGSVSTTVLGVARTGRYLTVVATQRDGETVEDVPAGARVLASAVDDVCDLDGGGACSEKVAAAAADPVPVADVPTMIVDADLPPVAKVRFDWVGSDPDRRVSVNDASTRCDATSFSGRFRGARFTRNATRTFLIPDASRLPVEFGLTETVGELPVGRAEALVDRIRSQMSSCEERDPGTEVTLLRERVTGQGRRGEEVSVWRVSVEVTARRTIVYDMAVVRHGGAVAQVGFVAAGERTVTQGSFLALAERALSRLRAGVRAR